MSRNWLITEKIIAAFLVIWGSLMLFSLAYSVFSIFNFYYRNGWIKWDDISYQKVFINYHLAILLPLLKIFAGLLLLSGKRIGWVMALIAVIAGALSWFIPDDIDSEQHWLNFENFKLSLVTIGIIIIFLVIASLLLLRPFIIKYHPSRKTWWTIASVIFLILLEKTVLSFIS